MKKLFSVLSGIVMTVAAFAAVFTLGMNTKKASAEGPHTHCVCGGNVAVLNDANAAGHTEAVAEHGTCDSTQVWTAWTDATKLPTESGYYYLTTDVTTASNLIGADNTELYLCLNGYTVTQTASRTYTGYGKGAGDSASVGHSYHLSICDCTGNGKFTVDRTDTNDGGVFWVTQKPAQFDFYKITVDASKRVTSSQGGILEIPSSAAGSKVNIYDGVMMGGQATRGGAISIRATASNRSTFNMFGGVITGGKAAIIENSVATANGGNLYCSQCYINLYAGTIENGICIPGTGKTSSTNSTPKDYSAGASGNVAAFNSITTVTDDFLIRNGHQVGTDGRSHQKDIWVYSDKNNHSSYNGTDYDGTASSTKNYYPPTKHFHCECGENVDTSKSSHVCNSEHQWTALTKSVDVANNGEYYYYLTGDLSSAISFGGGSSNLKQSVKVHLCLNGYNITTSTASRGLSLWGDANSSLTICDCGAYTSDSVYHSGRVGYPVDRTELFNASTTQGFVLSFKGPMTLYNGTIDASMRLANNNGGAIYAGTDVEVFGGHVIGATLNSSPSRSAGDARDNFGAAVYASGKFTMYGGDIEGGTIMAGLEARGASVYCGKQFTMHGGKIHGGHVIQFSSDKKYARGGCVYAAGNFTMTGGEISDGISSVDESVTANKWAVAGCVYMYGTTNSITGGTISGGTAGAAGNIYIGADRTLTIENATITGGHGNTGGNLEVEGATITIKAGTVFSNGVTAASSTGGNICVSKGNLTIEGGTFTGGQAGKGGNISFDSNGQDSTLLIYGGLFENGVALQSDYSVPNIRIYATSESYTTTATITGGTFTVTDASKQNSIWIHKNAIVDISGENTFVQRVYIQEGGAAPLHGGYTDTMPMDRCLQSGYGAVLLDTPVTSEGQTFKYEICVAHTVNATSWLVDNNGAKVSSGIANVSGAGYAKNDVGGVVLTTTEVPNYTFIGWAMLASEDSSVIMPIPEANELQYTTEGQDSDEFYVALYKLANTTAHYEVTGNATVTDLEKSGDVALGTEITITYNGTNPFAGFTNEMNKLISTSTTLTLTIYTDTNIIAVEKAAVQNQTEIIYMTESKQIYKTATATSALTELEAVPTHYGKEGGFWSLSENGEEATLDEINAKIPSEVSVTLYLTGYTGKTPQSTLTESDNAQVKMTFGEATPVGEKFVVSFGATRLLPEGWTVVEQGILLTTSEDADLVYGASGIAKIRGTSTELSGVTSANINGVPAETTLRAVGYVVYLRADSTTPEYAYSAVKTVTTVAAE